MWNLNFKVFSDDNVWVSIELLITFSGSEVEVVPDLLLSGAFAHIDATMIEWHERLAKLDDRKKLSNDLQVK